MKHKDMSKRERELLEEQLKEAGYLDFEVFSEEPYFQLPCGTVIYIDVVDLIDLDGTK